jgi:hypothetical protein
MLPPNKTHEKFRLTRNTPPYFASVGLLFNASQKEKNIISLSHDALLIQVTAK